MAQRYGGKYSPQGESDTPQPGTKPEGSFRAARRTRAGGRVNLLFLAPLPLIWSAFGNGPTALALNLAALGLLLLAAWLTREGLIAQEAYDARSVARRPAFPRKIAGSIFTGLGLALAGFAATGGMLAPLIYLVIGAALHLLAFGPDPLKDKGMEGVDMFQTDRVARAVDEAEMHLTAMTEAMKRAGDRQMMARLDQFQTTARDLFRTVENDPRDLTAARKYLSVYLMGARDATIKFADIYARTADAQARADYAALLDDLEQNFAARTRKLLLDDRSDLTIEIDVLRDRLKREGVTSH
ncbi:5-bromo-4-chloroindolyl phosphate hydrolysis protein [Thalassovita litoralis]|uniref:5-bromo-4-chloroindolyl phosphate hydrolysis protein n=1 Tax=Thalassovita litoralis TaxID=1010611 RepID=A0A521DLM0_9RHOB|nr:5-bromo-4-chloroindolyl phosphate hydrolysis family protein [Thalassovita litoralis]SMO72505.1 5-bromo-4-chloroindolyl phosphate hydrolysis protein [Thalassovita litoralis]